jgi:polyferredoxin
MFFTLFATFTTLRKLRKDRVGFFKDERRSIHIRLISMVVVFFLIWVFITILRGYEYGGSKSPYIFVLSTYIFVPGRGLFDALVYVS